MCNDCSMSVGTIEALYRQAGYWTLILPTLFSLNSLNYGVHHIFPGRYLQGKHDYHEKVGISWLVTEKSRLSTS